MPFARIDLANGKPPEYRATVADVVYEGIVGILKAPDGDRFMIIGEHKPENFVYDPNFLDIKRTPDLIYIQVTSTVGTKRTPATPLPSGGEQEYDRRPAERSALIQPQTSKKRGTRRGRKRWEPRTVDTRNRPEKSPLDRSAHADRRLNPLKISEPPWAPLLLSTTRWVSDCSS
jgi:hypothetical protein